MFQISLRSPSRKTASALTVLAAMGASGLVPEQAQAVIELEPTQAARGTNASYLGTGFPANWKNWNTETGNTGIGPNQRGYATWAVDFGAGPINSASVRIEPINHNATYGVPVGATLDLALITEPWTPATPDNSPPGNNSGPSVGTTPVTEFVQRTAPVDIPFNADVTSLLQHWQSNPSAYFGIRMYFSSASGAQCGVYAPNTPPPDSQGVTANLVLDQTVPEPSTVSLLALGGAIGLRRRRRPKLAE
jgi:hypothetical protein